MVRASITMEMTKEELLYELNQKELQIEQLTRELASYRNFFHGRKIAVSAEVAPSTEGESNCLEHQKDRRTFDIIESALLANEFLCQLEQFQIDEMINAMQPMMFGPEQWIIRQGEFGSKLYVLEDGKVQVTKDSQFLRVMEAPCVFGELAILYHCERTASIKTLCNCRVWALERRIFHAVMVNTAKSKHDELVTLMTKSKMQKMFTEEQIDELADSAKDEEWVFRAEVDQCQLEGKLFLVVAGQIEK
ncbi:unnamed protein product [Bursaphelenchus okinawaensis]|uniref:Cyclic nucleotide-binding domain-containing protein n=1 Tax=Bursaphelenchus okinawaensis TaxID=465554 RepID=A0A811L3A6_9BILA|nr:unnamed protein product [Bursaphelenchus okinawaensis]CAG9115566.1 unnamed protein product [Bursaphelenchus okinawaensis]